jgi:hypothetical protein
MPDLTSTTPLLSHLPDAIVFIDHKGVARPADIEEFHAAVGSRARQLDWKKFALNNLGYVFFVWTERLVDVIINFAATDDIVLAAAKNYLKRLSADRYRLTLFHQGWDDFTFNSVTDVVDAIEMMALRRRTASTEARISSITACPDELLARVLHACSLHKYKLTKQLGDELEKMGALNHANLISEDLALLFAGKGLDRYLGTEWRKILSDKNLHNTLIHRAYATAMLRDYVAVAASNVPITLETVAAKLDGKDPTAVNYLRTLIPLEAGRKRVVLSVLSKDDPWSLMRL